MVAEKKGQFGREIIGRRAGNKAGRGASNLIRMTIGHLAILSVATASGFIIPRILGAVKFGQFAAVLAVISIMQAVSSCGLEQASIRYLAPMWRSIKQSNSTIQLASSIWTARLFLALLAGLIVAFWLRLSSKLELDTLICIVLGFLCIFRTAFQAARTMFLPLGQIGKMVGFELLRTGLNLPVVVLLFVNFGLSVVFWGLLVLSMILFFVCKSTLIEMIPLRLSTYKWSTLKPFISYSLLSHIGGLSGIVFAHFSVYMVANNVAKQEAAILAIAVLIYSAVRDLYISARRSLMPILAEIADQDQIIRLRYWGELIVRYGALVACFLVVCWSIFGEYITRLLLTNSFSPVYPITTIILLSGIFNFCAIGCNSLLRIQELAGTASINTITYGTVMVAGLFLVIRGDITNVLYHIALVYVLASLTFWLGAYFSLGIRGKIWLPLRRTLLLILPSLLVWPASTWEFTFFWKLTAAVGFSVFYILYTVRLRLLPKQEIVVIFHLLRQNFKGIRKENII